MPQFENLDTSALVDLLANNTQRLSELMPVMEHGGEYEDCKKTVEQLQIEIEHRKNNESNISVSSKNNFI